MVVSLQHDVPHLAQVVVGDVLVEQVGHAVDEHVGRLPPPEGFVEPSRAQGDVEPLGPTAAAAEPFGDAKRVTVVAPGAHLGTAGDRVLGVRGPRNAAILTHPLHPSAMTRHRLISSSQAIDTAATCTTSP